MSGPSSGSFRVVSEAELARRRVQAAEALLRPARRGWEECAHLARQLGLSFTAPPLSLRSHGLDEVTNQAEEFRAATASLRTACAAEEARRARERMFEAVFWSRGDPEDAQVDRQDYANFLRRLANGGQETPAPIREPPDWRTTTSETVARILGRVPADTDEQARDAVRSLAQRAVHAGAPGDADRLTGDLRILQADLSRAALRRAAEAERFARVAALLARLDGVSGPDADRIRRALHRAPTDRTVDLSDFAETVTSVIDHARTLQNKVQDQIFAITNTAGVLTDMGYETEEGFETALRGGKPVHIARREWPGYAIRIEANKGRLRLCPVRAEAATSLDDEAVEREFCSDIERALPAIAKRGVDLDLDKRRRPGVSPVMIVRPGEPGEVFVTTLLPLFPIASSGLESADSRPQSTPVELLSRPLPGPQ